MNGRKYDFLELAEKASAGELVMSAVSAAKAQVEYSRELSTSKRAEILLGEKAGQEDYVKAEMQYRQRNSQLQSIKQRLTHLTDRLDDSQKRRVEEFIKRGGFKDYAVYARQTTVLRLVNLNITPEDTAKAIRQLDGSLEKIKNLTSLKATNAYVQEHIDDILAKKMGNPNANPFCVLGLIITSLFVILVIIAALICALTLGLACEGIMDQLIDNVCG